MTDDSDQTVLGQRACGESLPTDPGEPSVGVIVLDVCRVDEGDQDVDVEQKDRHGLSSRS
jgi:hypothetical protein